MHIVMSLVMRKVCEAYVEIALVVSDEPERLHHGVNQQNVRH